MFYFVVIIEWSFSIAEPAATRDKFVCRKPDPYVSKLDETLAVSPPDYTELYDRDESEASLWFRNNLFR